MNPLDLLFISLATWYASYAITKTHGPFRAFEALRNRLPLGGLTTCIVCLSVWAAAAFYLLSLIALPVVQIVGMAGAAILLHRFTGGDHV